MRVFVVIAWIVGILITAVDAFRNAAFSIEHAIAILLIAAVGAISELWDKKS